MQTERLRQLADLIEKRRFLFDQTSIGHLGADPLGDNCGLAGCLAEWTYRIYGAGEADDEPTWMQRTMKIGEFAREALGLTERQSQTLFNRYWPNWWIRVLGLTNDRQIEVVGFTPSARQAAQVLRQIGEMNDVPANERDCPAIALADTGRREP